MYKTADFNRVPVDTLSNDEAIQYIKDTRNRSALADEIGFLGTPFLDPKKGKDATQHYNYLGGVGQLTGSKEFEYKTFFKDRDIENDKIAKLFENQKIKPSYFVNTDKFGDNNTGSLYPIYNKPKGQLPSKPIIPNKPSPSKVNYDPTYENLKMRSL
jgi:hypothetical protein